MITAALVRLRAPAFALVATFAISAVCVLLLETSAGTPALSVRVSSSAPAVLAFADQSVFAPMPGTAQSVPSLGERQRLASAYARLPLAFEPNRGQFDRLALFAARGRGYSLFLTRHAAVLRLIRGSGRSTHGGVLSIGFIDASRRSRLIAGSALPGRVNYFIGRNPAHWHARIPTYSRVLYRHLWPGIDAAFYGTQGELEYDLYVSPGADPRQVGLSFNGARSLHEVRGGALLTRLRDGSVRQLTPRAYQLVGGTRRSVASRYVLRSKRIGLRLGRYDHHLPLVIDPVLLYSTYLGGTGADNANGIALDASGAAYITGLTGSTDFSTQNAYQSMKQGVGGNLFVTKLDPSGSSLVYSTYIGGSNGAQGGAAIAVDSTGSAYVTGDTTASNFPTMNAFQSMNANPGNADVFVTKLAPSGSSLTYSTYLGGLADDFGRAITVDSTGAAYLTGVTNSSSDFPTKNPYLSASSGGSDAFVTKLAPSGSSLVYSTYLGGSNTDAGNGIALDSLRDAYVTGGTLSTDFPTKNPYQAANAGGGGDAFVTKFDPSGSLLYYSTYLGGTGADEAKGIAVDTAGAAYVAGDTTSTDFPTSNADQAANAGSQDAFVTKLDPSGSALAYSTYLGGSGPDVANGIAIDSSGAAYVTGYTSSVDFPTMNAYQATTGGGADAFLTKLVSAGSALVYSTYLGGTGGDTAYGIAVDTSGAPYVVGSTESTDFPTKNAYQASNAGGDDAFVARFSGLPIGVTEPATGVGQTAATLNGTVNPNGDATTYYVQYGTSTTYGSQPATQSAGSDNSNHAVSTSITGLAPATTYHFRIVATNSSGTSYGGDQAFTTTSSPVTSMPPPAAVVVPKFVLLGAPTPSSTGVSFSLLCQAAAGTICQGSAQLTTLEHLLLKRILALTSRKKKRHTKRVVIGSKAFSLAAGAQQKIVVPLNATGRRLLARFHRLPATFTITLLNTKPPTVTTTKVTIRAKKKKKRKRHH
jgi:Beta-propeller repeat